MKIGIAQLNPTVGAFKQNSLKIIEAYNHLVNQGADLVITGELVVCGYTPRDLLMRSGFVNRNKEALDSIAIEIGDIPLIVGFVDHNFSKIGKPFYNAAAWCQNSIIKETFNKCLLPNYDVFDEDRYFEPAKEPGIVAYNGSRIGITLCEDIWNAPCEKGTVRYQKDPVEFLAQNDVDLVLNLSASPWYVGKLEERIQILQKVTQKCKAPIVYVNLVGGNDELIFDGRSMALNEQGEVIELLNEFSEDKSVIDLDKKSSAIEYVKDEIAEIYNALVLGLHDYAKKCHFKKAILGLSGGIDSAVVAALASDALGAENVIGVSMPSAISSNHSIKDAQQLAENLKVKFHQIPISPVVKSMDTALASIFKDTQPNEAEENIQARIRGSIIMAMSNKFGYLALSTGNKSEMAVGYCTLYGDMCGGLGVISDVPKTKVYQLAKYINRKSEIIPINTIEKPPSAELKPDQKDEDSLPPYETLDPILDRYLVKAQSAKEIIAAGFNERTVLDILIKVDRNEYKRRQAAPGLKVESTAFGVGRRIPIVSEK